MSCRLVWFQAFAFLGAGGGPMLFCTISILKFKICSLFSCHEIKEVKPTKVKNIGIWIRYDSRSGSHNA